MVVLERAQLTLPERQAKWAQLAAARETLLATEKSTGSTLLVPMAWQTHDTGLVVTTMWDQQVDFTYSQSQSVFDFDTPPSYLGPLGTPVINLNQNDEWLQATNAAFWNDGDAASETSYCFAVWVDVVASTNNHALWSKTTAFNTAGTDWHLYIDSNEKLILRIFDDDANAFIGRIVDTSISDGLHHLVVTKADDNAGGTPIELSLDIIIYVDGEAAAVSDNISGTYLAQEDGTRNVRIGAELDGGSPNGNSLVGAWAGPIFRQVGTGAVWTPDVIRRDYQLCRASLGL